MLNIVSFVWGFAEATIFFIVPDVWLTFIAVKYGFKRALTGLVFAVVGALLGGVVMYCVGRFTSINAYAFFDRIPGISPQLIDTAYGQIERHQILALFPGLFRGIPYKIYATRLGQAGANFVTMIIVSIFARGLRFLGVVALAYYAGKALRKISKIKNIDIILLILSWLAFYIIYYICHGW